MVRQNLSKNYLVTISCFLLRASLVLAAQLYCVRQNMSMLVLSIL